MLSPVIFWLFITAVSLQLCYAGYFFRRVLLLKGRPLQDRSGPARRKVSVIICAKNEASNLKQHLPMVLGQNYSGEDELPAYEVVVVNDGSTDGTEEVLKELGVRHQHLRFVSVDPDAERHFKGKKFALNIGVQEATHEWLLFTDADCRPSSENWIRHMVQPLEEGKEISVGYGGHIRRDGILNAFSRWETMNTFFQYATYALAGKPYMAVGRNLACLKKAFLHARQSAVWNKLPSGDDDLLMQAYANGENTVVVAHPDSFTWSEGKNSWAEWLSQKQRHVSTGKYYRTDIIVLLLLYAWSHAVTWLGFGLLLMLDQQIPLVLCLMGLRCLVYWNFWRVTCFRLNDRQLAAWVPVFDIGWMIYNFAVIPYGIWKNKQQWR